MILVVDNYDSFTYNLVQYLGELGHTSLVVRNDEIFPTDVGRLTPTHVLISPGPCTPKEAGISVDVIKTYAGKIPILGVCLGHQSLGYAFGGNIVRAKKLMHGKTSQITHDAKGVFHGLKNPFTATRYHSLVIEKKTCPKDLLITATSEDGEIMGVRHRTLPALEGVQFHPESILTEGGKALLSNFLKMKVGRRQRVSV
jgi:anthranilate synthase/aminodeoxychorismate synthase-like glutamine amidotransferase